MNEPEDQGMDRVMRRVSAAVVEGSRTDERAFLAAVEQGLSKPRQSASPRVFSLPGRGVARVLSGMAAVLVLTATVVGMRYYTRPAAVLAYQTAAVSASTELARGTRLQSHEGERAILALDDRRIQMHMNESTSLRIVSSDRIELDQGEIWCDVRPNSGRFEVDTPHGTVVVTGTRFGIVTLPIGLRLQLLEGEVTFEYAGQVETVHPGSEVCVGKGDAAPKSTPARVAEPPGWSSELLARASAEATARYYPSGMPGN